jgi:hypothetical protein
LLENRKVSGSLGGYSVSTVRKPHKDRLWIIETQDQHKIFTLPQGKRRVGSIDRVAPVGTLISVSEWTHCFNAAMLNL